MKISQLPEDVKIKALENQRNASIGWEKKTNNLDQAFDWEDSEEGHDYWSEWYDKEFIEVTWRGKTTRKTFVGPSAGKTIIEEEKTNLFDFIIEDTLKEISSLLIVKGKEYRRNNDPFHNFNEGSKSTGEIPEKVLKGFLLKHEISINDMVQDLEQGILPTKEKVNEKFNDNIIYLLIQKAMILHRLEK
jgi:hypothetical protein